MIVEIGAAIAVLGALLRTLAKFYELVRHQEEQDRSIQDIKRENALMIDGLHACLDGLEQLGANHTVPVAKEKLYNHINEQAHK